MFGTVLNVPRTFTAKGHTEKIDNYLMIFRLIIFALSDPFQGFWDVSYPQIGTRTCVNQGVRNVLKISEISLSLDGR